MCFKLGIHNERPDDIIKECHFLRVVHTKETPSILRRIEQLQGQNCIYYAGAYSMEGMGLLEQAARSGENAARHIKEQTKNWRGSSLQTGEKGPVRKGLGKTKAQSGARRRHQGSSEGANGNEDSWTLIS